MMLADSRAVLVQDEFDLARPCQVTWAMTTQAEISPRKSLALLKYGGKELIARVLSPPGATFTVASAEQKPPQRANTGFRRLMVRLDNQAGTVRVAVLLSPAWADAKPAKPPKIVPIGDW